jgi:hypothetical protein
MDLIKKILLLLLSLKEIIQYIHFDLQPKRMYKWLKAKRKKGLNVTENDKAL